MSASKLKSYEALNAIDMLLSNTEPGYPFQLNQRAVFTQHQITLYRSTYCHTDAPPDKKTGGAEQPIGIAFIDY